MGEPAVGVTVVVDGGVVVFATGGQLGLIQQQHLAEGEHLGLDPVDDCVDLLAIQREGPVLVFRWAIRIVIEIPAIRQVGVELELGNHIVGIEFIDHVDGELRHLLQLPVGIGVRGVERVARCSSQGVEHHIDVAGHLLPVPPGPELLVERIDGVPIEQCLGHRLVGDRGGGGNPGAGE